MKLNFTGRMTDLGAPKVMFVLLWVSPMYVVTFSETFTALISLQPLVGNQAYIPHIKAIYVPFHMIYGRLMIF